jgi:hypothetical protein
MGVIISGLGPLTGSQAKTPADEQLSPRQVGQDHAEVAEESCSPQGGQNASEAIHSGTRNP